MAQDHLAASSPLPEHTRLAAFAGEWDGEEVVFPSRWNAGGPATSHVVVAGNVVVVDGMALPSTRIGSLRAIGTARCESGSGLRRRSSYQPAFRSAGSCSVIEPAAAFGVGQ